MALDNKYLLYLLKGSVTVTEMLAFTTLHMCTTELMLLMVNIPTYILTFFGIHDIYVLLAS